MKTGISPNYVKGWDTSKAIREIVQNYLDTLAEFKCRGRITWDKGYATVKDNGPGLEMKHLALGVSEKSDTAKGQFGEGLKLALLVLAREGRKVEITTKNQRIRPLIEHDPNFGTDVMVLDVRPLKKETFQGTTIRVECFEEELASAKSYFIEFMSANTFRWLDKGQISLPGGDLYLNGTRIGRIENSQFSYHLSGKINLGNRDREVIDINKVRPHIRNLISATKSYEVIKTVLQCLLVEQRRSEEVNVGIDSGYVSPAAEKVWRKAFRDLVGKNGVLATGIPHTDQYADELGHTVVPVDWMWRQALTDLGVPSASSIRQAKPKSAKVPKTQLTETEDKVLRTAKRLVRLHYNDPGKVTVVGTVKNLAADDQQVLGYYSPDENRIYLARKVLGNLPEALHTLLHECVHKYSGASDNTRRFEDALLNVATQMVLKKAKYQPA